ncbi:MAG: 3-dehydroquinate synthase [Actinomycetota bacterium]
MKELSVEAGVSSYPYFVGSGLLSKIADLVPVVADKIALVHDAALPEMLVDQVCASFDSAGIPIMRLPIPSGEDAKTMETAERLCDAMASGGMHRSDAVIGLGGGATTDLSGFVAAIFHRGIEHIALPTTLLGMVDASIGGKTGVNLPSGKNLAGAFHQPQAVVCDVDALLTLSEAELRSGMAEVIKHGLIADTGILKELEIHARAIEVREAGRLAEIVARAASVKIAVVGQDATEKDVRAYLNYGHTLGHALETLGHAGSGPLLRHGEAVSLGMMFVAFLAVELGYANRIADHEAALSSAHLPTSGAEIEFDEVLTVMRKDKKYDRGLRFVVLEDLGAPTIVSGLGQEILRSAYEAVR